ncbi:carboxypeptidase D-like [Glandiceps talaboti]
MSSTYLLNTHLYSIGKSVEGRELWVMAIAGSDPHKVIDGRPEVKYVGNMHGNEVIGRELLLQFIEDLLVRYTDDDEEIVTFLDQTRVHILPSMNPDGFEISTDSCTGNVGRFNKNGLNLNRNFPDYFEENEDEIQPETQAILDWIAEIPFIISANLHGGTLVANYPFDNIEPEKKIDPPNPYSESPDDDILRNISLVYSMNHAVMHSDDTDGFVDGVTNGANWYAVKGGMQDYNYVYAGCMEITLELSHCKYPNASTLPTFWNDNKVSLLEYLKQVHRGVKGQVLDENDNPVAGATVHVKDRYIGFKTTINGYFFRILMPGDYVIVVSRLPHYDNYFTSLLKAYDIVIGSVDDVIAISKVMRGEVEKEGYLTTEKSVSVSSVLYDVSVLDLVIPTAPVPTPTEVTHRLFVEDEDDVKLASFHVCFLFDGPITKL